MGERQILRTSSYLTLLAEPKKERLMDLMDDEIMGKMSTDSQQERRDLFCTLEFCERERARLDTSDDLSFLEDREAEVAVPITIETKRGDLDWAKPLGDLPPSDAIQSRPRDFSPNRRYDPSWFLFFQNIADKMGQKVAYDETCKYFTIDKEQFDFDNFTRAYRRRRNELKTQRT